jgi:hypothetical protein
MIYERRGKGGGREVLQDGKVITTRQILQVASQPEGPSENLKENRWGCGDLCRKASFVGGAPGSPGRRQDITRTSPGHFCQDILGAGYQDFMRLKLVPAGYVRQ